MLSSVVKTSLRPTCLRAVSSQASRSMTILSKQSGEEYKQYNYKERMSKTGRPVSPHVTIYAFPVVAISSITNRVTGIMLSLGAAGLGAVELVGGSGSATGLMELIGGSGALIATTAKFSVAFPVTYHYLGGVRHWAWDHFPDMLTNVDAEKTSYALVASSLVLSAGITFM